MTASFFLQEVPACCEDGKCEYEGMVDSVKEFTAAIEGEHFAPGTDYNAYLFPEVMANMEISLNSIREIVEDLRYYPQFHDDDNSYTFLDKRSEDPSYFENGHDLETISGSQSEGQACHSNISPHEYRGLFSRFFFVVFARAR